MNEAKALHIVLYCKLENFESYVTLTLSSHLIFL